MSLSKRKHNLEQNKKTDPLEHEKESSAGSKNKSINLCILYDVVSKKSIDMSYKNICEMFGDNVISFYYFQFCYYRFLNGNRDLDFDESSAPKSPQLLEMPTDEKNLIIDELDATAILVLRNVCTKLRSFCENRDVKFDDICVRNRGDHVQFEFDSRVQSSIIYAKPNFDPKGNHKNSLVIRGNDFQNDFFKDLRWLLKKPKLELDWFRIDVGESDQDPSKFYENFMSTLKTVPHKISASTVDIRVTKPSNVLRVLGHLKAEPIHLIQLRVKDWPKCSKNDETIDEIIRSDHWQRATDIDIFNESGFFMKRDLPRAVKCYSFTGMSIESSDDFVRFANRLLRSESFIRGTFTTEESHETKKILKSIGIQGPPNGSYSRHYTIPDSEMFLEIQFHKSGSVWINKYHM